MGVSQTLSSEANPDRLGDCAFRRRPCRVWLDKSACPKDPVKDKVIRVLGIDPGSRLCGWGIVVRVGSTITHVDNGVFVLEPHGALPARLGYLLESLERLLDTYRPDVLGAESVFQHRNARSALVLGQARGVALAAAARRGLEVHEYTPMQVKKAVTGSGRAGKEQMQQMIALRMGLSEVPQVDAADAVAVAVCHAQHMGLAGNPVLAAAPRRSKKSAKAALEALVLAQQRSRT